MSYQDVIIASGCIALGAILGFLIGRCRDLINEGRDD